MKKKRKSSVQIEKWEEKVRVLLKHTNDTSTVIIKVIILYRKSHSENTVHL